MIEFGATSVRDDSGDPSPGIPPVLDLPVTVLEISLAGKCEYADIFFPPPLVSGMTYLVQTEMGMFSPVQCIPW